MIAFGTANVSNSQKKKKSENKDRGWGDKIRLLPVKTYGHDETSSQLKRKIAGVQYSIEDGWERHTAWKCREEWNV